MRKRMSNRGYHRRVICTERTKKEVFHRLPFFMHTFQNLQRSQLLQSILFYHCISMFQQKCFSGQGEGFLSAFVILSSLLYYMRRDDTDIFADKNEGKVLIMDNPFAQTNASHLLIPLMDMAKKSNTQLICLTGLGGESIYNRFDNIYVLNLIAASLRGGTQYLKAEHKRGKEPDELVTARIEVGDQMELLF